MKLLRFKCQYGFVIGANMSFIAFADERKALCRRGGHSKACTGILVAIPGNELKHLFDMLLDCAKSCIKAEGDYFE